jgi:hypothetical protein
MCVQGPGAGVKEEEGKIVIAASNPISCLHEYAKKVKSYFFKPETTGKSFYHAVFRISIRLMRILIYRKDLVVLLDPVKF